MTDTAIAELAPEVGVRAACEVLGAAQAGYYRRHRQSPPPQRLGPIPQRDRRQPRALSDDRAASHPRAAAQRPVRRPFTDPGVGHAAGRRGLPGLDLDVLPAAAPGRGGPGTAPPGHPPGHREAGAGRDHAEPGVVVGHHQAARAGEVDLLLPVCDLGYLLPVRGRVDGRHPRVRGPGPGTDPPDLRQAGHSGRAVDHPRRPRFLDDLQAGGVPARRPRRDPVAQPTRTSPTTTPTARPSSRR